MFLSNGFTVKRGSEAKERLKWETNNVYTPFYHFFLPENIFKINFLNFIIVLYLWKNSYKDGIRSGMYNSHSVPNPFLKYFVWLFAWIGLLFIF